MQKFIKSIKLQNVLKTKIGYRDTLEEILMNFLVTSC
jgi:hypothetical protein